ncbi:hypothetical protein RSOLAG22IIIB_07592 [Rhizoctonia solani]|uniref:Uncharacterized protein n=1 Tax=Rhizoctonia solani TaxID=456999 RepID=A0A0K6FNW6_9AGAM|nr:hypothetical protein RSOLAG22IIIB_07592 [Rhizoctonia solani]
MNSGKGREGSFFVPTPFWCWINVEYKTAKYGEHLWLWVAGVGNLVIYSVLALLFCGCFGNQEQGDSQEKRQLRCEGWLQLLNPLGYTILVLPISIVRWMYISKPSTPPLTDPKPSSLAAATLVFHATFRLSGLINALLVLFTRSGLLLINSTGELYHGDPRREWEEHRGGRQWEEEGQGEGEGQQEEGHRQQEEQEEDQKEEKRQQEGDDQRE